MIELDMESNKLYNKSNKNNKAADQVIDLIDTLMNTPVDKQKVPLKKQLNSSKNKPEENNIVMRQISIRNNSTESFDGNSNTDHFSPIHLYRNSNKNTNNDTKFPSDTENMNDTESVNSYQNDISENLSSKRIEEEGIEQMTDDDFIEVYGDIENPPEKNKNVSKPKSTNNSRKMPVNIKQDNNKTNFIDRFASKRTLNTNQQISNTNQQISNTNQRVIDNEQYLDDVQTITKELSVNMINDVKENIEQTQQYLKDNKYELIINFINYLIMIIDFLNRLIYKIFIFVQEKIMGKDNNFSNVIKFYFDLVIDFIVKKTSDRTIDTLSQMNQTDQKSHTTSMYPRNKNIPNNNK
jgi:hypothetical protein